MLKYLLWILPAMSFAGAANAGDDHLDACGVTNIFGGNLDAEDCPLMKGHCVTIGWKNIEVGDDEWDWEQLDREIMEATENGLYLNTLLVYTGVQAPQWLFDKVGIVMTTGNQRKPWKTHLQGPYPNYKNPEYKMRFKRMLKKVRDHLDTLPPDRRARIVCIQAILGKSGDEKPWDGEPLPEYMDYNITKQEFHAFCRDMWLEYKKLYDETNPRIYVLANAGNDGRDHDWLHENCPGFWRKVGHVGHGFQLNDEQDQYRIYGDYLHSKVAGVQIRARAEADGIGPGGQSKEFYRKALYQNFHAHQCWALVFGLDFHNQLSGTLENKDLWPTMEFFNRYAGRKQAEVSPGAFCYLRDGLDVSNTERFPEEGFGEAKRDNLDRYIAIAKKFEDRGALLEDTERVAGSAMDNRWAQGYNDVGWRIWPGNYEKFMTQIRPDETSVGHWHVGNPDDPDDRYGRFARGFDHASGRNAMAFQLDAALWGGLPLKKWKKLRIEVAYFDLGAGSWELRYDSMDDPSKVALNVTNTDSGKWKVAAAEIQDGRFGRNGENSSDLALTNTDSENNIFGQIEIVDASAK